MGIEFAHWLSVRAHTVLASLLFLHGFAAAAEVKVNDDLGIAFQSSPKVTTAPYGFVVGFVDERRGHSDVFIQCFDISGQPINQNRKLNSDPGLSHQAEIALESNHYPLVQSVWIDYRNGNFPFSNDIFFKRLDTLPNSTDSNVLLTGETTDSLVSSPDISSWPNGRCFVVWADYRHGHWDIFGRLFNANGLPLAPSVKINDDNTGIQQHAPRVEVAPDGWFVVVWYDKRFGSDDIFCQRFLSDGTKVGSNFRVNTNGATSRQAFPDVATDGNGNFTVVWVDWRNGTYPHNSDIYARKLDFGLTTLSSEFQVNRDASNRTQREPAIAADIYGNVSIVWADSTSTSWDVVGQMLDVNGMIREAAFQASTQLTASQVSPDVAINGRLRCVTWSDARNGDWDVYTSIQTYNNPQITAEPSTLSLKWYKNEPLPTAIVELGHQGYNPLPFVVQEAPSWLSVSPSSGMTPESLSITLDTVNLVETSASGTVLLLAGTDSVRIFVSLEKFETSLQLAPDSLELFVNLAYDTAISIPCSITSTGSEMQWTLNSRPTWLVSSAESGTTPETISFGLAFTALSVGTHVGYSVFESPESMDAETLITVVHVDDESTQAGEDQEDPNLKLHQNFPNPCNPGTTISFELPSADQVSLDIINLLGQHVVTLANRTYPAGESALTWTGTDRQGRVVSSGIYFYRLKTSTQTLIRKLALFK